MRELSFLLTRIKTCFDPHKTNLLVARCGLIGLMIRALTSHIKPRLESQSDPVVRIISHSSVDAVGRTPKRNIFVCVFRPERRSRLLDTFICLRANSPYFKVKRTSDGMARCISAPEDAVTA